MASSYNLRENFLEESFILQKHLGMSYSDIKNLPIIYRRWYIERLSKHFKQVNSKNKNSNSQKISQPSIMGMQNNSSEVTGNQDNLKKVERFFKKFAE